MNGLGRALTYFALFSEIGLVFLVTTLGGALAGHWLDERLGTNPVFALVGLLGGFAVGAIGVSRLITRFLARIEATEGGSPDGGPGRERVERRTGDGDDGR